MGSVTKKAFLVSTFTIFSVFFILISIGLIGNVNIGKDFNREANVKYLVGYLELICINVDKYILIEKNEDLKSKFEQYKKEILKNVSIKDDSKVGINIVCLRNLIHILNDFNMFMDVSLKGQVKKEDAWIVIHIKYKVIDVIGLVERILKETN